jgi:hypothetical protein
LIDALCYSQAMIRRFAIAWLWVVLCSGTLWAQGSYPLLSGEVVTGDPIHFNAQGAVFKRPDGSFTSRAAWTNFTEAALKELGKDPKAKPFVDQYLETIEEEEAETKAAEITVKPVPRLQRPNLKAGFGAIFTSPLSLTLILLVWAANIYAGYEIALFRNYPWMLVCGIAAVVPVIGPALFLCLPTYIKPEEVVEEVEAQHNEVPIALPGAEAAATAAAAAPAAAAATHAAPQHPVYKRGQTTFNRRFFETKFANFLRVTPTEAEKDLVLVIKSARGEHAGSRIARINPNDLHLLVTKGDASHEVMIPFTEIQEVQLKHKNT